MGDVRCLFQSHALRSTSLNLTIIVMSLTNEIIVKHIWTQPLYREHRNVTYPNDDPF